MLAAHAAYVLSRRYWEGRAEWLALCTEEVKQASTDPRLLAYCIGYLLRIQPRRVSSVAKHRLARLPYLTHWEPQWFDAWSGQLTALDVALEVLHDSHGFAELARDAARFILSTQPSWGQWHSSRGAAHALRALARLNPLAPAHGVLEIEVDGEVVRRIEAKSDDLYAAALAFRSQELELGPGQHDVRVRWSGESRARVQLLHEHYDAHNNAIDDARAADTILDRQVPPSTTAGQRFAVSYSLAGHGPRVLRQPLSAGCDAQLDGLESTPEVDAAWREDSVAIIAISRDATEASIAFACSSPGEVQLMPAVLEDARGFETARSSSSPLRVVPTQVQ